MKIDRLSIFMFRLAGIFVGLTGLAVMVGWLTGNAALVQLHPSFEAMKFNTAALLFITSFGLLAIGRRDTRPAIAIGAFVATASLIILSQFMLGLDYGIDTLVTNAALTQHSVYPGRFSVNTGCCFVISGTALVLSGIAGRQKSIIFMLGVAGCLLVALTVPPLLGYLTGTEEYYVWGAAVGMAFHTALCFLLIGASFLRVVIRQPAENITWLPLPVFAMLVVLTVTFCQASENDHRRELGGIVQAEATAIGHNSKLYLDGLFQAIQRINSRWERQGGTPQRLWEADATEYLHAYPVLLALSWANADSRLQWLVSLKTLKKMPNFNIAFEDTRRAAINRARESGMPQMTGLVHLVQGGIGFVGYNPLYVNKRYDGMIVSSFNVDDLFGTLLAKGSQSDYKIEVFINDQKAYDNGAPGLENSKDMQASSAMFIRGREWRFNFTPTPQFLTSHPSPVAHLLLIIGLIVSALASLSMHFGVREKLARNMLKHSRDQMVYFVKHIPVAFAVCDADMRYLMVSDRWYSDFRLPSENIIGRTHFEVFFNSPDKWREILFDCLKSGASSDSEDMITLKSGRIMWLRWIVRPWYKNDGALGGLLMATEIITERKDAESKLRIARDAADAASRAKSDFLADMSHEIRTPMNAIIGMTRMLMRSSLDRSQMHYAGTVLRSAESLMQIISDILDLSKIEAGKTVIEEIPFSLRALCEDAAEVFRLQTEIAPANSSLGAVTFNLEYGDHLPDWVVGDPLRIRQVVYNLCGNAMKFTRAGSVTLRVAAKEVTENTATLVISVQDTGIGIHPDKLQTIFNKFDQADETITRNFGGSGLGLAISNRLVMLMGSRIEVTSAPGKGSDFFFTLALPLASPSEVTGFLDEDDGAAAAVYHYRNTCVLLAEDSLPNQEILAALLQRYGIETVIAGNGEEALAILPTREFDLVLMDCKMPRMDGFEATANIRKFPPPLGNITIVALTANALEGDREKCLAAGMDDYLPKPVRETRLLQLLGTWLPVEKRVLEVSVTAAGDMPRPDSDGDIDSVMLQETRSALGERFDGVLAGFLSETQNLLGFIATAIEAGNIAEVSNLAHIVKSSTRQFGAPKVGTQAELMQARADDGDAAALPPLLKSLKRDWDSFVTALQKRNGV
ncbi:MAG: ATP-binding protein [Micavibrio sp.]|nr:ATP-binding protein [Micavibrio sp.]